MSSVKVKVVGGEQLAARLKGMGAGAPQMMEAALHAGALKIQTAAKQLAPKRTRTLSRSIIVTTEAKGGRVEARIGPTVEYGKYIEYGTGIYAESGNGRHTPWVYKGSNGKFYTTQGAKPKPYLRPAFDENREAAIKEFNRVLQVLINKARGDS